MDITPEDLKRVAEYMGHATDVRCFEGCSVFIKRLREEESGYEGFYEWELYSPLTNPEQLLELIELLIKTFWCIIEGDIDSYRVCTNTHCIAEEKTLPEAVIKAVLEMIGDK